MVLPQAVHDDGVEALRMTREPRREIGAIAVAVGRGTERMNRERKSREVWIVRGVAGGNFDFMPRILHSHAATANAFNRTAGAWIDACKHV
jgi:hypothetical protein